MLCPQRIFEELHWYSLYYYAFNINALHTLVLTALLDASRVIQQTPDILVMLQYTFCDVMGEPILYQVCYINHISPPVVKFEVNGDIMQLALHNDLYHI